MKPLIEREPFKPNYVFFSSDHVRYINAPYCFARDHLPLNLYHHRKGMRQQHRFGGDHHKK